MRAMPGIRPASRSSRSSANARAADGSTSIARFRLRTPGPPHRAARPRAPAVRPPTFTLITETIWRGAADRQGAS
ncbi:hypothetical protein X946_3522 [Burkholderia sp. ABCPW 111]|nr:hypothetical protein X946_3522 [Burkholderia sp. ABCPW 111]